MDTLFVQGLENIPHHFLPFLAFIAFIIILFKWPYTKKNHQLPSPRKLPIIGNLHQLGTLPHRSLRLLSNKYGGELMLLHLGTKPTLVVSSAKAAEEIMKTHDTVFANRPNSQVASIVLYNGRDVAFARYGEYWRQVKSICVLHMLSNKKVQSYRKIREEEVSLMVELIRKSPPCMPVNLTDSFTRLTNDVVSRVAFGRKYAWEEGCENIKELLRDFSAALGAFSIGDFIPWLSWIDQVTGVLRKATKVAKAFDAFIDNIVQEHIDRLKLEGEDDGEADKGDKVQDLVDVLLEIQRNDPSLERDSVKALLLDMLAAGIETTSTLLEWVMSELLTHPQAMKKLQDEVRGSTKGKTIIDEDDLKKMTYLKAVMKEALRLHPPLPLLLFREPSQNVKVHNYDIAAGTQVIINAWAIQRHPTSWDEPEEFRPERFLKNTSVDMMGQNFDFIPFGSGRRGCPGISFATVQAELALANLVSEFDWEVLGEMQGSSFMAEMFGTSVSRRDPLMAIPTPYSRNTKKN